MAPLRILRLHALGPAVFLLVAGITTAPAQDRCEGTLCDLYYDHMAKPAQPQAQQAARTSAQPAQPQPAQTGGEGLLSHLFGGASPPAQADTAPPAKKPMVAVQGGGVVGLLQGRAPSRCTGTLCDFYYGGPPPEEPAATEPAAAPTPAAARAAEAEIDEPAAPTRGVEPRESVRSCPANSRDPWACYR